MQEVWIVTRDINGKRTDHYLHWDSVYPYIYQKNITDDDEILLVIVEGTCIYSSLSSDSITRWALLGFFA
jgi:hypothetical protein